VDKDLREAERTGDQARLLRFKMKSGQLSWERVKLAAQLGDADAKQLFPEQPPNFSIFSNSVLSLGRLLRKAEEVLGKSKIVEFAADCSEKVLNIFETRYPKDLRPRNAIIAARMWAKSRARKESWTSNIARQCVAADAAAARASADGSSHAARAAWSAYWTSRSTLMILASDAASRAIMAAANVSDDTRITHKWQIQRLIFILKD